MPFKIFILLCLVAQMLGGCSTMFAHYRIADEDAIMRGSFHAVAKMCVENNFWQPSDVEEYMYYSRSLLAISVYNSNIYEQSYNKTLYDLSKESLDSRRTGCEQLKPNLATVTETRKKEYIETSERLGHARVAEMQNISNSLDSVGRSFNESAAIINESAATINKSSSSLTLPTPTTSSVAPNYLGTNSAVNSGNPNSKVYQGVSGKHYDYDLSNPGDKTMYDVDPAAKLNDSLNVDPLVDIDRGLGQYGGGVEQ